MEKIYLNSEEYDTAVDAYRNRYGYDDMFDEEKEIFDEQLDKVIARKDDKNDDAKDEELLDISEDDDSGDKRSDSEKFRNEIKAKYGYENLSEEQKRIFDANLDGLGGEETSDPNQPEKVLRRIR